MTLIQSSVGRFDTTLTSVMNDVRQPVFVDNAVHYAKIQPQSSNKSKITIETRNAQNYDLATEKTYTFVESESGMHITHNETDGHSLKGTIWTGKGKDTPTSLMYGVNKPSNRIIGGSNESTTSGVRVNVRNLKGNTLKDLGFNEETLRFGQIIDVGLRTTDLAMKLGNSITGTVTAVTIGDSPTIANLGKNRRKVSNTYLAADFNGVNLLSALRFISRHDNRISIFNRYGALQYVPFNFSNGIKQLNPQFRSGSEDKSPVENTENRITVQGEAIALNEKLILTMDDGARQQGKFDTDILENTTPIYDASISSVQSAKKVARQILKANSIMRGAIVTNGHPDAWDLRPGSVVEYGNNMYVVMESKHKLSDRMSDFTFLTLDTGIEGVLQSITKGSISRGSIENPDKSSQIVDENLSFFDSLDVFITPIITLRQVSSSGLIIGKNANRRGVGGANTINDGITTYTIKPTGLNKSAVVIMRGES